MLNFLNNMNLLPTNFIVANIVEVLKEDPENGVDKLYEMSQNFITDPQIQQTVKEIKSYYDS
ncbi:radical SAM protein, partial [Turicibacter sanguinis]|nr:radical SAM protein [Turicibacter sanguinis]